MIKKRKSVKVKSIEKNIKVKIKEKIYKSENQRKSIKVKQKKYIRVVQKLIHKVTSNVQQSNLVRICEYKYKISSRASEREK